MTKKLVLVGCGNVGSRHLQALAKLPYDIVVDVVEPNKNSQLLAKSRLNEISYDKSNHDFFWHENINELTDESDLVIDATLSVGRVDRLNQLLKQGHLRFLIEKMVCQSIHEYELLLNSMKNFNAKGWVNTNPRCFKSYQKIKKYLNNSGTIRFSVLASESVGFGTNAIHYIDLFSWLSNDYEIKLNGDFLMNKLLPNKRGESLKEFTGSIIGSVDNGSFLTISFLPSYDGPVIVNISGNNNHFIIDETNEKILVLNEKEGNDWEFKFEHVSTLTTMIVKDILDRDTCLLPTLQDSFYAHAELFRVFNTHIKKLLNYDLKLCPIT